MYFHVSSYDVLCGWKCVCLCVCVCECVCVCVHISKGVLCVFFIYQLAMFCVGGKISVLSFVYLIVFVCLVGWLVKVIHLWVHLWMNKLSRSRQGNWVK